MVKIIKNIIMDAGGVFIDTKTVTTANAIGVSPDQLKAVFGEAKKGDLWDNWLLGHIDGDEFERRLCNILEPDLQTVGHRWLSAECYASGLPIHDDVLKDMRYLRDVEGHPVFICSNIVDRTWDYLRDSGIVDSFDGGVYSCKEHMMKPDHAIYQLLLDRFHLDPRETAFFDDKLENCIAAREVGIIAYHWKGDVSLLDAFRSLTLS